MDNHIDAFKEKNEAVYLYKAVEKLGSAVLVRSYCIDRGTRRSKVDYLSDNIALFGMNMETISKGYRLPEDYIHPEDRENFQELISLAVRNQKDFSVDVRVIGDDGKLRDVNMSLVYLGRDGDWIRLEFIVSEARKNIKITNPLVELGEEEPVDPDKTVVILDREYVEANRLNDYFDCFAGACELYSVLLDLNGKIISEPKGPKSFLGEFYEMLEDRRFIEYYERIKNSLIQDKVPAIREIEDGKIDDEVSGAMKKYSDRRLAAAPIVINGTYCATWIMYAHNSTQAQKLFKTYNRQWEAAEVVSEHMSKLNSRLLHETEEKEKRDALEFEIKEKKIITKVLSELTGGVEIGDLNNAENLINTRDSSRIFEKLFERAGKLLDVDYVVYYENSDTNRDKMNLINYWSKYGRSEREERVFSWQYDHYNDELRTMITEEGLVIDRRNMTNKMRVEVFEGNARAVIVCPIKKKGNYIGRLIFIENSRERVWKESEVNFAKELGKLISKSFDMNGGITLDGGTAVLSEFVEQLLDVFNYIPKHVLIRNNENGNVFFASESLTEKLGFDLEGKDSFRLVPKNDNVSGTTVDGSELDVRVEGCAPSKFRRYINDLGDIFDITDIKMTWISGEPTSVLIFVPASD